MKEEERHDSTLRGRIKDWLESYIKDGSAAGVTDYIMHHVNRHLKTSFGVGFVLGIFFTIVILKWIS